MANNNLSGKTIVITGASSGFGKGAARAFAAAGANVVLAARREPPLEELERECMAAGGKALAIPTDVSKPEEVERLAQQALSRFGRIDVWVNNAGAGAIGRFEEVPLDEHRKVIETDLLGTLYGSHHAIRQFVQQGSGTLVNVASVIGKVPAPYFASYAAAKHGVVGLSGAIRQELRENNIENIHVSTVMPTSMDTPFFEHAANYSGHEVKPIPPVYEPEKVVDVIVKMATDPEDEVSVGTAGKLAVFFHQVAPGITEKMMGHQTHKAEVDESAPEGNSKRSLSQPAETGTELTGGWLKK